MYREGCYEVWSKVGKPKENYANPFWATPCNPRVSLTLLVTLERMILSNTFGSQEGFS